MATISFDIAWEGVREAGDLGALKTDIEKKIKTKKRLFEETNWRFRVDATYIRNVTVIMFEDCNDEEHVASAVYKVWSVTYSKRKGILTCWRVPIQINFEYKDRGCL